MSSSSSSSYQIKLTLSTFLSLLINRFVSVKYKDGITFLTFETLSNRIIRIMRPISNFNLYYNPTYFCGNFKYAFNKSFSIPDSGKKLILINDLDDKLKSIEYEAISDFKFLTCTLFSNCFNIILEPCNCYPLNLIDIIKYSNGIGPNCFHSCKDYDSIYFTQCPAMLNNFDLFIKSIQTQSKSSSISLTIKSEQSITNITSQTEETSNIIITKPQQFSQPLLNKSLIINSQPTIIRLGYIINEPIIEIKILNNTCTFNNDKQYTFKNLPLILIIQSTQIIIQDNNDLFFYYKITQNPSIFFYIESTSQIQMNDTNTSTNKKIPIMYGYVYDLGLL